TLGDAEVFGCLVETAEFCGVQWQDGQASVVVQCQNGIELMLKHVADDNRHCDSVGCNGRPFGCATDYRMAGRSRASRSGHDFRGRAQTAAAPYYARMLGQLSHTRVLRLAGLFTWALVSLPLIYTQYAPEEGVLQPPASLAVWLFA